MPLIKNTLEKILGNERVESLLDTRGYRIGVDVFAINTFSLMQTIPLELGIVGMTWLQFAKARAMGTIVNTFIGRPYGIYRDYIFRKTNTTQESSFGRRYLVDTIVSVTFQTPTYCGILALSGADSEQITKAAGTVTLLSGFLGRPYGVYLEAIRSSSGIGSKLEG